MTVEDDLRKLRAQAMLVVEIADTQYKEASANALMHLLRVFSYEGAAYITGIEAMMTTLGNYLGTIDPKSGAQLNRLGRMCAEEIEDTSVDAFLKELGICTTHSPESNLIYEQFRSGHINNSQIIEWLVSK